MSPYVSVADVCRRLNISYPTAKKILKDLPRVRIGGRFKYSEQDIQNLLKSGGQPASD
jgi:hypothetical protein